MEQNQFMKYNIQMVRLIIIGKVKQEVKEIMLFNNVVLEV